MVTLRSVFSHSRMAGVVAAAPKPKQPSRAPKPKQPIIIPMPKPKQLSHAPILFAPHQPSHPPPKRLREAASPDREGTIRLPDPSPDSVFWYGHRPKMQPVDSPWRKWGSILCSKSAVLAKAERATHATKASAQKPKPLAAKSPPVRRRIRKACVPYPLPPSRKPSGPPPPKPHPPSYPPPPKPHPKAFPPVVSSRLLVFQQMMGEPWQPQSISQHVYRPAQMLYACASDSEETCSEGQCSGETYSEETCSGV